MGGQKQAEPVLYIEPGSHLALSYRNFVSYFANTAPTRSKEEKNDTLAATKQVLDVARYMKNYEGPLARNGETIDKYRFSDEREWRYVPDYSSPCKMLYTEREFSKDETQKQAANNISEMRLAFDPNDVKYIIIKDDTEINEFVEHLRKAKGKRYTHDDIERLTTRILTSEQIHNDI